MDRVWFSRHALPSRRHRRRRGCGPAVTLRQLPAASCQLPAPADPRLRPGVQRKHDNRGATDLARLYRAGELTPVRIPTEAEERVRDVVRCRETFEREIRISRSSWPAGDSCSARGRASARRTSNGSST